MRIDPQDLRRHYASLSDGEILSIDREELTDVAQSVYDEEFSRRGLGEEQEAGEADESGEASGEEARLLEELEDDDGEQPDWLEDGAVACSFSISPGNPSASKAAHARATLRDAGIPSHLTVTREGPGDDDSPARELVCVMVPGALALHATSILDRDLFNDEFEEDWRTHLEALSDDDLESLDPKIFCAGFLDKVARMKKVYAAEMADRKLKARP